MHLYRITLCGERLNPIQHESVRLCGERLTSMEIQIVPCYTMWQGRSCKRSLHECVLIILRRGGSCAILFPDRYVLLQFAFNQITAEGIVLQYCRRGLVMAPNDEVILQIPSCYEQLNTYHKQDEKLSDSDSISTGLCLIKMKTQPQLTNDTFACWCMTPHSNTASVHNQQSRCQRCDKHPRICKALRSDPSFCGH